MKKVLVGIEDGSKQFAVSKVILTYSSTTGTCKL